MSDENEPSPLRSAARDTATVPAGVPVASDLELVAERERLRVTLESIGDAVITTDAEGRVTFENQVAEELTGWPLAEAAGRAIEDVFRVVNETSREPVANPVRGALDTGATLALANHTLLISRDGSVRPIDDSAAPIRDRSGASLGAVLVFRDVTERRRADEIRARLAAIVESSDDAIVSKTLEGTIRSWNAGAERIFGWTSAEIVGQHITTIIPTDRWNEEQEIIAQLRKGERIEHYETVRMGKDGRLIDVSLTVSPLRSSDGTIIGASKVARDITARRRADNVIRDSESRFRTLARLAPVGIYFTDGTGVCDFVNDRWCSFAGISPIEALGKSWLEVLHPDDRERITRAWSAATEDGRDFAEEYRFRRPDGTVTWLQGNAVALEGEAGVITGFLGTLTDITELRAASEALKEADRVKDDFIALLAHELRNPLAPLRNGLQIMRLMAHDPVTTAKARDIMERQLLHMVRLIDDLLDVSRISRRKMVLRRSRMLVTDVVSTAVETSRPVIDAAGHQLIVSVPPDAVYVDGDLVRLAQVLSNLLTNSAKYTDPPGTIELSVRVESEGVVFSVRDNGIGIATDVLDTIFDMFNQVDRTIERSSGGLGIGLALVKGITELHGGTVSVESAGIGKGSTFTVRLPTLELFSEPTSDRSPGEVHSATQDPKRILVVDDNVDSAGSMATMLEVLGHEVATAHDGALAVALAETFRPDLVLMDVGMPVMNGYDAARNIRAQSWGRTMPIFALTGWGQDADRARSKEAGCDGHIVKPVGLAELEALLARLPEIRAARSGS